MRPPTKMMFTVWKYHLKCQAAWHNQCDINFKSRLEAPKIKFIAWASGNIAFQPNLHCHRLLILSNRCCHLQFSQPQVKDSVSKFMAYVHMSVNQTSKEYLANERRYNYTTPKSFLEQIKLYRSLLGQRSKDLTTKMERLENGLEKLNSTSAQVPSTSCLLKCLPGLIKKVPHFMFPVHVGLKFEPFFSTI